MTLYCKPNSEAALYAIENGIAFHLIASDGSDYDGYIVDMDKTDFYTSSTIAVVNNYVPLTLNYSLKDIDISGLSNKRIIISLYEGLELIEKSVMLNGTAVTNYTYSNGTLTVPVSEAKGTIHFSVIPVSAGVLAAYAQFAYKAENEVKERIGIVYLDVPMLTINVPTQISNTSFEVGGICAASKTINISIDGINAQTVKSKKDGSYTATVSFPFSPVPGQAYTISAGLSDDPSVTATQTVLFSSDKPVLVQFDMYYYSHSLQKLDLLSVAGTRPSQEIFPGKPLKFVIRFNNPQCIDKVYVTSTKNGVVSRMAAIATSTTGEYIAEGLFENTPQSYVPGMINVRYTATFSSEDFEAELPYDELPIEWKEATVEEEDTGSSQVRKGTISLTDGGTVQYEYREGVSLDYVKSLVLPSKKSAKALSSRSLAAASIDASDDESMKAVIDFFKDLKKSYGKKVISNAEKLALGEDKEGVAVIQDDLGETLTYIFWNPAKDTLETVGIKFVGTHFVQEYSPGLSWSESGQAWGYIWGMAKAGYHALQDADSVSQTKASINASTTLTEAQKKEALDKMDNILLGYMAVDALRMVSATVGFALMATNPAAAILIPLVMNEFISFADKYLDDAMDYYAAGGQGNYFRWIIDPSGKVYDPETGEGMPGVTVTAYCILLDEDDPNFWTNMPDSSQYGELWDATEYSQSNPQVTGEDGSYAWDVPEGWWRIKYEKEGYETTWSDWMAVPPIQMEVDVQLEQHQGLVFQNTKTTGTSASVTLVNDTGKQSTILFLVAAYDHNGNMVICEMRNVNLVAGAGSEITISYSQGDVSIVKAFAFDPVTYVPLRRNWKKAV